MSRIILCFLPLLAIAGLGFWQAPPSTFNLQTTTTVDTTFDMQKALATLREEIKGKENLPADSVFQNIKLLKKVPAGRLLAMMEVAFSNSLGVTCEHCHVPDYWAKEDKPTKQVARDMWVMMGKINRELLKDIANLQSQNPTVNCTTCHRGAIKPAINLPAKN